MTRELYLYHHQGLGDHISMNGLIRSLLSTRYDKIYLYCRTEIENILRFMFRDENRVCLIPTSTDEEKDLLFKQNGNSTNKIKLGFEIAVILEKENPTFCLEKLLYLQMMIPWEHKYSHFCVERDHDEEQRVFDKLNPNNEPYIFVHDDPSTGFVHLETKTDLKIIKNDMSENIFNFRKIIEHAEEFHSAGSSFMCMVDLMDLDAFSTKLFFHENKFYEHTKKISQLKQDWIIV